MALFLKSNVTGSTPKRSLPIPKHVNAEDGTTTSRTPRNSEKFHWKATKLPNKIASESYSKKDLKGLIKRMKNAREYKPEIDASVEGLAENFIGSCQEYTAFENSIAELYMSGDPVKRQESYLKELSFELYYSKHIERREEKVIKPGRKTGREEEPDCKGPIVSVPLGEYALPNMYLISEFGYENRTLAIDMPKQFIYTGTRDSYINLCRHSGLTNEDAFTYEWLEATTSVMTETSIPGDEWDVLRYLYRYMGYASQFAEKNWLPSLVHSNREPRLVTGFKYTKRRELFSKEHIPIGEDHIPFEIEGIYFDVTFEELKECIIMAREERPDFFPYGIGECKDNRIPGYYFLLTKKGGKDPAEAMKFLLSNNTDQIIKDLEDARKEVFKREDPVYVEKDWEILAYYASYDERIELAEQIHVPLEKIQRYELMSQLGTRELTYQNLISMGKRDGANEELAAHYASEDKLLEEANAKYGTDIRRINQWDPFGYSELDEGALEDLGDLFAIPEPEPEQEIIHDIRGTNFGVVHHEPLQDWVESQREGGTYPARQVWDPGGTGTQIIKAVKR